MKALLLHANKFATKIVEKSTKPIGIEPEKRKSQNEQMKECLICFFTVEKNDTKDQINNFYNEIIKTAKELDTKNIMIAPFVHLSNNIASPSVAKDFYADLMNKFSGSDYKIASSHFGYHKSLLLDIKGHPGSFRYREF